MMPPPKFNQIPGSELESLKLAEMFRRRREVTDAALRGGHPYHLAKEWAFEEVPTAEISAVFEKRERLRAEENAASAKADSRPWWMAFIPHHGVE